MKKRTIQIGLLFTLCLVSIGCQSHSVQMTSGKKYLSGYTNHGSTDANASDLNEEVKAMANIEPSIQFPARIGLVKLFNGRITNLTVDEVEAWEESRAAMG